MGQAPARAIDGARYDKRQYYERGDAGKGDARRPGSRGAFERGYEGIRWRSKATTKRR